MIFLSNVIVINGNFSLQAIKFDDRTGNSIKACKLQPALHIFIISLACFKVRISNNDKVRDKLDTRFKKENLT
jgi:hypothetical protein